MILLFYIILNPKGEDREKYICHSTDWISPDWEEWIELCRTDSKKYKFASFHEYGSCFEKSDNSSIE